MNLKIMKSQLVEILDKDDIVDLKFKHENGFVSNITVRKDIYFEMSIIPLDFLETLHHKNYLEGFRLPDGRAYIKDFWS